MPGLKTLSGGTADISADTADALGASLRGDVYAAGSPEYDAARTLWNAMNDRRPGLVARAFGASDVQKVVDFARDHDLLLAIRSGGHQIAGHAVADGGLLLDLSQMRSVRVDAARRTVRVEPGATLGDIDRETEPHGLTVPTGINSTTGIAGLTLGGGFGWLTRKFGMTIDNLLSADVVTADGRLLTASATENPDLFWAIRGGGGNFGVITSFEFRLHPVGPEVLSGLIVHPLDAAEALLPAFARIADDAPDELTIWSVLRLAPPLPFLPEAWHGKPVLVFAVCYCGDLAVGEAALAELRGLGTPVAEAIGPTPLTGWQTAFDPLLTPGVRNYWKSHDFDSLPEEAISALVAAVTDLPDPASEIFVAHIGGQMARVPASETAFPSRSAHFIVNVHTRWEDPAKDDICIGWARDLFDRLSPYAIGSAYVNFMPADETARVPGIYLQNMERLSRVKAIYDPGNLFRVNHNIAPAT
ncbi:FAD-binding oxidoreductase [Pseudodonghicola flavimaris]|uniref:FAD-binding oxidoreductase n=1 Tax=Pseudodonghicola flavimaris TaxID=3050036 RepID=A0ABT7EX11_9RHOB|nr:FAD-binding oxidoreductase [Pseudodonghicola flavimaris]MDK3016883.1 FAD-binding oxidoreductase [Pseudodonghicola flavimaris]